MLNSMRTFVNIFFLLAIIGCSGSDSNNLKNAETLNSIFSDAEIDDLQIILDFFTEKICQSEKCNISNPFDCFEKYQERLNKTSPSSGWIDIPIEYSDQLQLYEKINSGVFTEIWIADESENKSPLGLNPRGKYAEFLELFGQENEAIKVYHENLLYGGGLIAVHTSDLLLFPEKYDNSDIRIRLIISIHYLTLNEESHRYGEN